MDFATARRKMVDNQVRPNDVTDLRLIAAMLETPRERFVSADRANLAYVDADLPIEEPGPGGAGRRLLRPMVLARLLQIAEITESDHVLDVACGTGYSSAILARLAKSVVALEDAPERAERAARLLAEMNVANVRVVSGPIEAGWPPAAPYDVILVNGAVELLPDKLLAQLKEGGRVVAIVGAGPVGVGTLYRSVANDVSGRAVFDAPAPALKAFARLKSFVF
jgi:protein-L-isoaspartate(D-aspartate) O-methyltransferase